MRELAPACPPVATASSDSVLSPSEAPYTAAASPAGPHPTTTRSNWNPGSARYVSPRCAANVPGVARSTVPSDVITSGIWLRRKPRPAR